MAGRRTIACVLAIAAACFLSGAAAQTEWFNLAPFNGTERTLVDFLASFPPAVQPDNTKVLGVNLTTSVASCTVFDNTDTATLARVLFAAVVNIDITAVNTTQFTCDNGTVAADLEIFFDPTTLPLADADAQLGTFLAFQAQNLIPSTLATELNVTTPLAVSVDWQQPWWQDLGLDASLNETTAIAGVDAFAQPVDAVSTVPISLSFSTNDCDAVKALGAEAMTDFSAVARAVVAKAAEVNASAVEFTNATCASNQATATVAWFINNATNSSAIQAAADNLNTGASAAVLLQYLGLHGFPVIPGTVTVTAGNASAVVPADSPALDNNSTIPDNNSTIPDNNSTIPDNNSTIPDVPESSPAPAPAPDTNSTNATATIPFSMSLTVSDVSIVNDTTFVAGLKNQFATYFNVNSSEVNLTVTVAPAVTKRRMLANTGTLSVVGTVANVPLTTTTEALTTKATAFELPATFTNQFGISAQTPLKATVNPNVTPSPSPSPSPPLAGTHAATSLFGTAVAAAIALLALLA